jgi:hypothetical protein
MPHSSHYKRRGIVKPRRLTPPDNIGARSPLGATVILQGLVWSLICSTDLDNLKVFAEWH